MSRGFRACSELLSVSILSGRDSDLHACAPKFDRAAMPDSFSYR